MGIARVLTVLGMIALAWVVVAAILYLVFKVAVTWACSLPLAQR